MGVGEVTQRERIEGARRKKLWGRVALAVILTILIVGTLFVARYYAAKEKASVPGTLYPEVGREHISLSQNPPKPYNSNPPSSGAHYSSPANWGIYDYEVNDKIFIHNLEHGGVWISYHPGIPLPVVDELKGFVGENRASKLVMAPRSANDTDIAVVVWGRVFKFNLENGALPGGALDQIRLFYRTLKDHAPEYVPDSMPGIDPKTIQ